MTKVTINLPNESDTDWVVKLLNRLQLDFNISDENSILSEKKAELKKSREIIMNYPGMTESDANDLLEHVKEGRIDRELPFRS